MKRALLLLMLTSTLFSQDVEDGAVESAPLEEASVAPPKPPSIEQRNWIFATGSLVAAILAIVVVSLNPGDPPPSSSHH